MPKFVLVLICFLVDSLYWCFRLVQCCLSPWSSVSLCLWKGIIFKAILLMKNQDLESLKANWGYIIWAPTPSCSVCFCPRLAYKCTCPCTLSTVLANYFLLPVSTNFYLMLFLIFIPNTFLFNLVALGIVGLVENSEQLTF